MKLLKQVRPSNSSNEAHITLIPQEKEDLFTLHQLIAKGDELIFKRKISLSAKEDANKKKQQELKKLRIIVESEEFDMKEEALRYKGKTVRDDDIARSGDYPVGMFFSVNVDYTYPITIIKYDFDHYCQKLLKESIQPATRADTAAVALQEGIAHVCVMTSSSTVLKQKIEYSLPKKKKATDVMKFDEKTQKFYRAIYESMKRNFDFDKLKVIILCSPGFYAKTLYDKIIQYAQEEQNKTVLNNKGKFLVAHCSTGYLQGITEVLKNPSYSSKLQDTKFSREVLTIDQFLQHLNDDDSKAWYGENEVFKAVGLGAVQTLLITDTLMRSDNVDDRKKFSALVQQVERNSGKVTVFSELHSSGEELNKLTGLACILNYAIPDLDEDLEEEEEEEDT
ncbi:probable protein DOM34 [Zygosaccharomyces bailii ISA1307]|nr:probable protein DOM34 [Zygosaccharomyces bailii ISA1307]